MSDHESEHFPEHHEIVGRRGSRYSYGAINESLYSSHSDPARPRARSDGHTRMTRNLTWFQLMLIVYFNTVGGAFGIEPAVAAGGPLYSLVAIVGVSFALALPQALMSAELSLLCSDDGNGGSFNWVYRGMGPLAAFSNSVNMFVQEFVSNSLLLVLFPAYAPTTLSWWNSAWLMAGVSVFFAVINVLGTETISALNYVFTPLVILPFFAVFFVALKRRLLAHRPLETLLQRPPLKDVKVSVFLSVLIWCLGGYDVVGYAAGEVIGGRAAYLWSLNGALLLGVFTYVVPIVLFYMIEPNYNNWVQGYLTTIAYDVSRGCGMAMVGAAMISTSAMFGSSVFPLVRVVAAAARVPDPERQIFPRIVGWSLTSKAGVVRPIGAIVFTTVVTWALALLPYVVLAESYLLFFLVNLSFEWGALFALRYREPSSMREFKIPGGYAMLIFMVIPVVVVMGALIATAAPLSLYIGLGAQPVIVILYYLRRACTGAQRAGFEPVD